MSKRDVLRLLEHWPGGQQLNLYLDNTFNATVLRREDIEDVTDGHILAKDCFGRTFLAPMDHISLFKFSDEPATAKKKNHH